MSKSSQGAFQNNSPSPLPVEPARKSHGKHAEKSRLLEVSALALIFPPHPRLFWEWVAISIQWVSYGELTGKHECGSPSEAGGSISDPLASPFPPRSPQH